MIREVDQRSNNDGSKILIHKVTATNQQSDEHLLAALRQMMMLRQGQDREFFIRLFRAYRGTGFIKSDSELRVEVIAALEEGFQDCDDIIPQLNPVVKYHKAVYKHWGYIPELHQVTKPDKSIVQLTPKQGDVFYPLIHRGGSLVHHKELLDLVSDGHEPTSIESLRVLIVQIRRRLKDTIIGWQGSLYKCHLISALKGDEKTGGYIFDPIEDAGNSRVFSFPNLWPFGGVLHLKT